MNYIIWMSVVLGTQFVSCLSDDYVEIAGDDISENDQLLFAHVIFRHGERNIEKTYPNDPYKDERFWEGGFGALTNAGKQEIFELGQFLRIKYQNLIGTKYSANDVYIRSTDFDRTLMSAQLIAAGMFPPSDEEKWHDEMNWQPVPIHTIPITQEHLLAWHIPCPRFMFLFENQSKSSERKALIDKYKYSIEFWEQNSGMKIETLADVMYLYDTLYVEERKGLAIPKWAEIALKANNSMEYLAAIHLETFTHTTELKKLEAGFIIKEMLDRFKNKTLSMLKPDHSIWIYAAHDLTLINILNALNLYELHIPAYGSSLHFELYKNDTQYYVQFSYRKSNTDDAKPLNIPNCGEKCPIYRFYELYRDIIPTTDYEILCRHPM